MQLVYPWGERGTFLEGKREPRAWQIEVLEKVAEHMKMNRALMREGLTPRMMRLAISSGHGIGKGVLMEFLRHWFMSVCPGGTAFLSANKEEQLRYKTWAEGERWRAVAVNSHWFKPETLKVVPAPWYEQRVREEMGVSTALYYSMGALWSEDNPDAYAGAHSQYGVFLGYDESSGIDGKIWKVSSGFFSDLTPYRFWIVLSNPRRVDGDFFECFHTRKHLWETKTVDSRDVEGVDPAFSQDLIDTWGIDSDEVRVMVRGLFPLRGTDQFLNPEEIDCARMRQGVYVDRDEPIVAGLDVAREGEDTSVLAFRRGRDARTLPPLQWKGLRTDQLADVVADQILRHRIKYLNIDMGSSGAGVYDLLVRNGFGAVVQGYWFSGKAARESAVDKRTEMWLELADWLPGGMLPLDDELSKQLKSPKKTYRADKTVLESTDSLKKRGLVSPDKAMALALTFARKIGTVVSGVAVRSAIVAQGLDYDVLNYD